MNALGTHDTPRIPHPCWAGERVPGPLPGVALQLPNGSGSAPSGKELLKLGAALLFAFPGSPRCIMGTRRGWRALRDPFNRRTFPWGHEEPELLDWFTRLGHLRQESAALRRGGIRYRVSDGPLLAFTRTCGEETILAAFNTGDQTAALRLEDGERVQLLLGAARFQSAPQGHTLTLPPRTGSLMRLLAGQGGGYGIF